MGVEILAAITSQLTSLNGVFLFLGNRGNLVFRAR